MEIETLEAIKKSIQAAKKTVDELVLKYPSDEAKLSVKKLDGALTWIAQRMTNIASSKTEAVAKK